MPASLALVWQPAASPLHIAAGAGFLAALALVAYARTFRERPVSASLLAAMRLAAIAALGVLLLGPSREESSSSRPSRPRLSILLDTSASMATRDDSGTARIDLARREWLSEDRVAAIAQEFDVELNAFDEELRPLSRAQLAVPAEEAASGRATRLAASVSRAVSQMPGGRDGAAMLVISDGRDSDDAAIQPAAALAKNREIPVSTVLVGRDTEVTDLAVLAIPMQDYVLPGESGAILVKVYQSGLATAATTVQVSSGGKTQSIPVAFNGRSVVELQVPVRHDEPGQHEHAVSVDLVEDEADEANNRTTVFCDVQRKRMKVLLLEGQPYWDTKFLAQSLRKDERIELVQITQLTGQKRETIVTRTGDAAALPQSADEWSAYDVVILGRGIERILDDVAAAQLRGYVIEQGGHLVFARGPAWDPASANGRALDEKLGALAPVEWGGDPIRDVPVALTSSGRLSQWLASGKMGLNVEPALSRLPNVESVSPSRGEKPATVVLARAADASRPAGSEPQGPSVLAQMTAGRGSVFAVSGDGLWRWSLLPEGQPELAGFYDAFWSNLVRWMMMGGDFQPGQQVSLKLARSTSRLGDRLAVDVVYKHRSPSGAPPRLTVIDARGKREEVVLEPRPGREPRFQALLDPRAAGAYRVALSAPGMTPAEQEQRFSVYDVNEERLNTAVNPIPLKALAEHSGGAFHEVDGIDAFLARLRRHRLSLEAPPRLEFVWDDWRLMALLLVWAGAEWVWRRSLGWL